MTLTPKARQQLKAKAHKLRPVVMIGGKGLTENVNREIDQALTIHELIKIRIQAEDRDERREMLEHIVEQHHAELVQLIGGIGTIYRQNESD